MFGKINQKLLLDVVIASVIVDVAPDLINKYLFKDKPLTGVTLQAAAGAVGFMVGNLMKKPVVANVSIGVAASGFISDMIKENLIDTESLPVVPASYAYAVDNKAPASDVATAEYLRLSEYTNSYSPSRNYSQFYQN